MPYINIRLGTALDNAQREQLYNKTTTLINTVMSKCREVTVVHIQEDDPQQWATNAVALTTEERTAAYVDIKVTEGTNTPEEKAEMVSETVMMLQDVVGAVQEACYVVIDDIPANSWGYNGKTQAVRAVSKQ
ncbi:MAG: tautomerase family protein [Candidatus Thiodiazotropha sp. (ex Lucinoma kastoroae)]|nr:tautomerase family protein [Candidatus Thiodiazotropha sp. (ex Lucinoma kastoroae)]